MVGLLILLALTTSHLYLWQSGLPQICHIIAMIALGLRTLMRPKIKWQSFLAFGLMFVFYVFFVDLIVWYKYGDIKTILAPTYYIFNFLIFILLINVIQEKGQNFLSKVFWIHLILLATNVALAFFGIGRTFGDTRAMGFFNDPNQIGHWILWSVVIIGTTGRVVYKTWLPGIIVLCLAMLGIVFNASRSALIGLIVVLGLYIIMGFIYLPNIFIAKLRATSVLFITLIITLLMISTIGIEIARSSGNFRGVTLINKITSQVDFLERRLFEERDPDDTFEGRGYDRIWKFPEYLIFGAGEGATQRFARRTRFLGEIHSTWAGLFFNYGIIGIVLFLGFIFKLLYKIKQPWFKIMALGPFVYGFFTYNFRNWYFWVGLAVVYSSWKLIKKEEIRN